MVSEMLKVVNKAGFHMRPAEIFVREMRRFDAEVVIHYNGRAVDGKDLMKVMAACMKQGAEILVECNGPDEAEALEAAVDLIRSGFCAEVKNKD